MVQIYSLLVLSLVLSTGAAANDRWVTQAPQTDTEAGYLVSGASRESVEILIKKKNARARVLHEPTGLYEIYDISAETIHGALPHADIQKNVVFEDMIPTPIRNTPPSFKIDDCTRSSKSPAAVITPLEKVEDFANPMKSPILDMTNAKTSFSSLKSTDSDGKSTTGLQYLWLVYGPRGSKWQEVETGGEKLDLMPDLPGGYFVYLVVRNNVGVCGMQKLIFGVTWNQPYSGAVAPRAFDETDRKRFKHLATIKAEESWQVTRGQGAVIAVLDSGVNYNHPDLSSNILYNAGEIPFNGLDDDGNGYIDDTVGWDFTGGDAMPMDDNSHGTHVAGLAASAVSGVAPKAKILPVKVMSALGRGDSGSIRAGVMYAADRGAHIINASFGTENPNSSAFYKTAIEYAEKKGVLFVAASGNGDADTGLGLDTDVRPHYPSSLVMPSILSVSATNLLGQLSIYSNYGFKSVHIAAPGGDSHTDGALYAAGFYPLKDMYIAMEGTSMATPVVAGAAALAKSRYPAMQAVQLKQLIMGRGSKIPALAGKNVSESLLDAKALVQ